MKTLSIGFFIRNFFSIYFFPQDLLFKVLNWILNLMLPPRLFFLVLNYLSLRIIGGHLFLQALIFKRAIKILLLHKLGHLTSEFKFLSFRKIVNFLSLFWHNFQIHHSKCFSFIAREITIGFELMNTIIHSIAVLWSFTTSIATYYVLIRF